jgi:hypothetical protein
MRDQHLMNFLGTMFPLDPFAVLLEARVSGVGTMLPVMRPRGVVIMVESDVPGLSSEISFLSEGLV